MNQLIDPFQRKITYLRLSVTDRCDFRCTYCMPEKMKFLPKKDVLSIEELYIVCSCLISLGINKIRITGGEPLIKKGIMKLFWKLSKYLDNKMLKELTLTTNGSQLAKFANELHETGVKRINVSLDTLSSEKFKRLTKNGDFENVIKGIKTAKKVGLKVKINTVALKGINDNEVNQLINWCGDEGFDLTFIEVMPMGTFEDKERLNQFWSLKNLKKSIKEKWSIVDIPLTTGGPAKYSLIKETGQKLGFISPLSNNFCGNCNRIRITCKGELFNCLGQNGLINLNYSIKNPGENYKYLKDKIKKCISKKPYGHNFDYKNNILKGKLERFMSHTGG